MVSRTRVSNPAPPLFHAILAQGARKPSHAQLGNVSGVGERTVEKKLEEFSSFRGLVGGHPVKLGPGLGMVLGLSMGAESMRAALVDANGDIRARDQEPPSQGQLEARPTDLLGRLRRLSVRVLQQGLGDSANWSGNEPSLRLLGVSVAWPWSIDRAFRPFGSALADKDWSRTNNRGRIVPLTERVSDAFGPPFIVERCHALNDANAQALEVAFVSARDRAGEEPGDRWRIGLVVKVGSGLGAATTVLAPHSPSRLSFIDTRLLGGTNGFAGELAHLPIERAVISARNDQNPYDRLARMSYDRPRCSCGRRHHLGAFASGIALAERLKASGYELPADGPERASMIRGLFGGEADQEQVHAVKDVGRILGRGLAAPVLMLDPYSITLTGSLASEPLRQGVLLEREIWGHAIGDTVEVEFLSGERGEYCAARGAALAVLRRYIYRQFSSGVGVRNSSFELTSTAVDALAARS